MHDLEIKAIKIRENHALQKIYDQWDNFNKTLDAFSDEQKADYLKGLVIDNELVSTYNKNLPYFHTPSYEVQVLMATDTPCHIIFYYIIQSLVDLGVIRERFYTTKKHVVIIWTEDFPKLSKNLKAKLKMRE